eukprot:TRINITY_DN60398_c0_g1_i1.p1 TRINITY_DN60398_c0_g1~~TRINITY_DN60398_c0_g1_i1.p1  ORF type:complete len:364 (+),score=176.02 TRINITY_DN60398_c0_g1_i1:33-1124(+)
MGASVSEYLKFSDTLPTSIPLTYRLKNTIETWHLTNTEVRYLFRLFQELDEDGSGGIGYDEYFGFLREPRQQFIDTMFQLVVGLNTTLDFEAWLRTILQFCLATREEIVERVFCLFDTNKNGFIELHELHHLLVSLHSTNSIFSREIVAALTERNLSQGGTLDYDDFVQADSQYPMLLWPVFRFQHRMRKRTLGIAFFKSIEARLEEEYQVAQQRPLLQQQEHHSRIFKVAKDVWRIWVMGLFCCCIRPGPREPTPTIEVTARRKYMRKVLQLNARRTEKARHVHNQELDNEHRVRRHHVKTDFDLEDFLTKLKETPLRENDLIRRPFRLTVIGEDGREVELDEERPSPVLSEVEEDEYPDAP